MGGGGKSVVGEGLGEGKRKTLLPKGDYAARCEGAAGVFLIESSKVRRSQM